jgi:hypothetical protein
MIRKLIRFTALAAFVGVSACEDALVVDNPNAPNKNTLLGGSDVEVLIGTYFKRWHSGVYGSTSNMEGRLNVWSFANFSSLANNCQNTSYPFANNNITNQPGNTCQGETFRLYTVMHEVNRVATDVLGRVGNGSDSLDLGSRARNLRTKAFAEFLRGIALGYLAMMHDSATTLTPGAAEKDQGTLVYYTEVLDTAYASLARAIAIASDPASFDITVGGPDGFPLPEGWIPTAGHRTFDNIEFIRLVKSFRARIRANVARTPAERAAADWTAIIADATEGFLSSNPSTDPPDFLIKTGGTDGFTTAGWRSQYNAFSTWHQMPPFIIGMADVSGRYNAWLQTPLGDRGLTGGFFMVTPDLRWPQGSTRTAQQSDFALSSCQQPSVRCKRYFRNRSASDDQLSGQGWGFSNYDFARFRSWHSRGDAGVAREGKTPYMVMSELRLLRAEGNFRQGNYAAVLPDVNFSRTRGMLCQNGTTPSATTCTTAQTVAWGGGLPQITVADATTPVPGGASCVPQVPIPPTFDNAVCGTLWEALKYEKRMETLNTHYLAWYLDSRGWGDLAFGTPLFLPVPFNDWLARGKPRADIYDSGVGSRSAPNSFAPTVGTYGW